MTVVDFRRCPSTLVMPNPIPDLYVTIFYGVEVTKGTMFLNTFFV